MRHFISLADCSPAQLTHVLDVSSTLKEELHKRGANDPMLGGRTLALVFEKPSLRTRVSFEVAMTQLGGRGLLLRDDEVGLGRREPVKDVARVLGSMCDGIMARVFEHEKLVELARHSPVPVINGLSDYNHPCQAMADMLTIREHFKKLEGLTLAYIGDGNNVARSLAVACAHFGIRFVISTPPGYELPRDDIERIKSRLPALDVHEVRDPVEAVRNADVLYTDTWVSMGQEEQKQKRLKDFAGYTIDGRLLKAAPSHAIILHCLPAYRGYEISDEAVEHERSRIFQQAENRLHAQKGLLAILLGGK
jgi:ornithine carbamoyltransferase